LVVIDGIDYTSMLTPTSADWGTTGTNAHIGTRVDGVAVPGHDYTNRGAIDEMAIWLDRALTVDEAIRLYQALRSSPSRRASPCSPPARCSWCDAAAAERNRATHALPHIHQGPPPTTLRGVPDISLGATTLLF